MAGTLRMRDKLKSTRFSIFKARKGQNALEKFFAHFGNVKITRGILTGPKWNVKIALAKFSAPIWNVKIAIGILTIQIWNAKIALGKYPVCKWKNQNAMAKWPGQS